MAILVLVISSFAPCFSPQCAGCATERRNRVTGNPWFQFNKTIAITGSNINSPYFPSARRAPIIGEFIGANQAVTDSHPGYDTGNQHSRAVHIDILIQQQSAGRHLGQGSPPPTTWDIIILISSNSCLILSIRYMVDRTSFSVLYISLILRNDKNFQFAERCVMM